MCLLGLFSPLLEVFPWYILKLSCDKYLININITCKIRCILVVFACCILVYSNMLFIQCVRTWVFIQLYLGIHNKKDEFVLIIMRGFQVSNTLLILDFN